MQLLHWKAFMRLNPFHYDRERADVRAAMIALAVWNVQIAKGKSPTFRKIKEFLMTWGDSDAAELFEARRSERDQWDDLKRYAEAVGKAE